MAGRTGRRHHHRSGFVPGKRIRDRGGNSTGSTEVGRCQEFRPSRVMRGTQGPRSMDHRPGELTHPRDELMQAMERIYRYRMTTTSGKTSRSATTTARSGSPGRVDKEASAATTSSVSVPMALSTAGTDLVGVSLPPRRSTRSGPISHAIVHTPWWGLVAFSICRRVPDTRLLAPVAADLRRGRVPAYAAPRKRDARAEHCRDVRQRGSTASCWRTTAS